MLCFMVYENRNTTLVDFDLEYPLPKLLEQMLDNAEGHEVGCQCKHCMSLEVLALMIMTEEDNANI